MNNGNALFLGILLSLAGSFWALILAPQLQIGRAQLRQLEGGAGQYPNPRPGLAQRGAEVYRSLGCADCHTRQVRQSGVEFEVVVKDIGTNKAAIVAALGMPDAEQLLTKLPATVARHLTPKEAQKLAGRVLGAGGEAAAIIVPLGADIQRGWGARLSVAQDYLYDQPVQLGNLRYGPDLANFGHRLGSVDDLHKHLYDSALVVKGSPMPPYRFLYEKQPLAKGAVVPDGAIVLTPSGTNSTVAGEMILPTEKAVALAAYLASLKSDAMLFEAPRPKPALPAPAATNNAAVPAK